MGPGIPDKQFLPYLNTSADLRFMLNDDMFGELNSSRTRVSEPSAMMGTWCSATAPWKPVFCSRKNDPHKVKYVLSVPRRIKKNRYQAR